MHPELAENQVNHSASGKEQEHRFTNDLRCNCKYTSPL